MIVARRKQTMAIFALFGSIASMAGSASLAATESFAVLLSLGFCFSTTVLALQLLQPSDLVSYHGDVFHLRNEFAPWGCFHIERSSVHSFSMVLDEGTTRSFLVIHLKFDPDRKLSPLKPQTDLLRIRMIFVDPSLPKVVQILNSLLEERTVSEDDLEE